MRLYDETCLALCEGQFMDIWTPSTTTRSSVDFYFDMIGRKTAALIAGLDAGRRDAGHRRRGGRRGVPRASAGRSGIAFQLNDDLLGIWGEEQATGKEPSDLARHKKTLPVIYALEHGRPDDRARLDELFAATTPSGRGRRDPGSSSDRRARVHARPGAPLPRRGARRARRGRRRRAARRASASGDHHRRRDQRVARACARPRLPPRPPRCPRPVPDRQHLADTSAVGRLDRQRQHVDLGRVPTFGTPPTRW